MTDGELTSTCQAVNPAATSTVPVSPHQAAQRLRRPGPGRSSGQRAGTRPSPLTTISTASGAAISSIAAGTNEPPSRSGSPGRNHAITRIAGSTVSLANVTPPADGRGSAVTQRKRRPALAAPVPAAVNRPAHRAIPVVLPVPPALPPVAGTAFFSLAAVLRRAITPLDLAVPLTFVAAAAPAGPVSAVVRLSPDGIVSSVAPPAPERPSPVMAPSPATTPSLVRAPSPAAVPWAAAELSAGRSPERTDPTVDGG